MPDRFDAIVVGVGAMGSAACWQLARRGVKVLGIERFEVPHDKGSSHGQSRMIRMAYFEHPDYVPLLRRAYELWRETERAGNTQLLHEVGGIYIGPESGDVVGGSLKAARQHGLPHSLLDHRQLKDRFPQFHVPAEWVGLFEDRAGFLPPEKVVETQARLAREAGATIACNERVMRWEQTGNAVRVITDRARYDADQLIFTAGPWSDQLIEDLGIKLVVTRQVMGWVTPGRPELFRLGAFPVWAIERADGSLDYGFPMLDDSLKVAHHAPGMPTAPDSVIRTPLPADEADFRFALERYLPAANGPTVQTRICLYTNSPDHHFILGRHPKHSRVILACGFSGHGFKFASVIGEALADLATGTTSLPIGFLAPSRFA